MSGIDFHTLFTLELGYVMRTLRRLGVQEADVEDVTHEVFLAVHAALDRFDETRPVRPWLCAFAVRFASGYRRKLRPVEELENDDPIADVRPLADEAMGEHEDRRLVLAALERIPLARRAVFVMAELDGVTVVEIARVLEIPEGTAHSRLHKAREEFEDAVRRLVRKEHHGRAHRIA